MEPIWSELSLERVAGRSVSQLLVESDIPIPSGREAQRILHAQGDIKNESAFCANGKVQAEGTLSLQILCLDQENNPFGIRASTQYNHEIPIADAKEGMRAQIRPQLLDLRCVLRDRRIRLEAVAELHTITQQNERLRVLSDVAGVEDLQKQYAETEIGVLQHAGGDTIRLQEDIPAAGVQQLLLANGTAQVNSVVLEPDGVTARGTLFAAAVYCDAEGQLNQVAQQIPFERLIALDLEAETCTDVSVIANVEDFSLHIGETEDLLEMEAAISLVAQCVAVERVQSLSDAFTPSGCCHCRQEMVERLSSISCQAQVSTVQESLRAPEDLPNALRAGCIGARPAVLGIKEHEGKLAVEGLLITGVVYQTDEGQLANFEEDVPFRMVLDAPYMPDADVQIRLLEARGNGGGNLFHCSFTLEARVVLRELVYLPLAVGLEEAEPQQRENGIMVCFAGAGETFWSVGKRFGIAIDELKKWNPEAAEPFSEGCPLMIMSANRSRAKQ